MDRKEVEKKYGKEFANLMFAGEQPTEQEISDSKEGWKAARGTAIEAAVMLENGDIYLTTRCTFPDSGSSYGEDTISADNPEYRKLCERFKLKKPGDSAKITQKWVDESWVDQEFVRGVMP